MVKLLKSLIGFVLVFALMMNLIYSHEGHHDHDHDHDHDHEHHEHETDDQIQGNLLDENGDEIIKSLGFDTKETFSKDEMKKLYENVFFKKDITDEEEKEFYRKIIDNVYSGLPDTVNASELRNYFDVNYLMKFIEEGFGDKTEEIQHEEQQTKDSL